MTIQKLQHYIRVSFERMRRWVKRRIVWSDFFDVWIAATSVLIRNVFFKQQSFGLPDALVASILLALILRFGATIRRRLRRDLDHAQSIYKLFQTMNEQLFSNDSKVRFTLFRLDPINPHRIIPWCRYRHGGDGPLKEADTSKMALAKGVGIAGFAWKHANEQDSKVCLWYVPKHNNLESLQNYYHDTWALNKTDVWRLSRYMLDVSWIMSVGWTDTNHQLLGILCIDFQFDFIYDESSGAFGYYDHYGFHEICAEELRIYFNTMQRCLSGIVTSKK